MSQSQERDEAGADLKAVVAAAFAAARGEEVTAAQKCAAARAAVRLEFFSERPKALYWRFVNAPALRARADALDPPTMERMAEPSDEQKARAAARRRQNAQPYRAAAASTESRAGEQGRLSAAAGDAGDLGAADSHKDLAKQMRAGARDTRRYADQLDPPAPLPDEEMGEHDFAEGRAAWTDEQLAAAAGAGRDPAADRWLVARGVAERAAAEARGAQAAAAEQPADAPRDALGRTFAQRQVQASSRLAQSSRRHLRGIDRLLARRRAGLEAHAEDDFDAPPQSDPVREAHKRLSDEDNDFMRRRGHRGDPVGHRHAAVDLCLDDQECRRLGVDFGAMAEDEDGNHQPDPYSFNGWRGDTGSGEASKRRRDDDNNWRRGATTPDIRGDYHDFPADDPRADHMAEGDDDIPFDHHSRPETVDDLEARHGHGTEAYWDALNNREANADPRHAWEIAQAAWLERERLHPEIHADSDDYAEGDGPAGHPGRGYFDPGVARRAWKGKTGLGLALRARGQNLPNDLGRAYLNLEGVEEGSPPLAPGTPPLNSPPCGGNSPHKHAEPPEDGQHWLGEPNAFGHEPRRAQYEARREAAECYRASGNLAMSRKAERAAKSGQRDDERTYPPRPFGSYAEGDPIPDDRDNSLTGHEIADARREEATRYARGGNLPMARRLRHNASDLEKETKPANAHPRAPEYADDSRGSAYAEEDDMSEQGVDLFTLPPRREFLRGYAEEEGMYDPFNPPARSEEEEAADVRAHQDRTIRNYEDYARSYDDPKRHRGEDDTVVDEHGRQVTDDYFKRRSRAEQKRADRYRTWRDTGHLPPDEADAMSEDGDIGQHFPENDGVARAYYARRRYADEARAAGNEAAARVHEQGAKQGRDVDPVHGHDHQPTAPRYPGEY